MDGYEVGGTGRECFAFTPWALDAQNSDEDTELRDNYDHKSSGLNEATQGKEQKLIDMSIGTQ